MSQNVRSWVVPMAMTEEWKPIWVQRIDSEIKGYEQERDKHRQMFEGYTKRLEELREKRKPWTDQEGKGGVGE